VLDFLKTANQTSKKSGTNYERRNKRGETYQHTTFNEKEPSLQWTISSIFIELLTRINFDEGGELL
jgi:hypothetical protein